MKYYLITTILLFLFLNPALASHETDTIGWSSSRLLKISDFTGNPPGSAPYIAETNYEIALNYKYTSDGRFVYSVQCLFHKKKSWMKKNKADSNVLHHEQGHFDLAEAYTRKLRQMLAAYKPNRVTFKKDIHEMYNRLIDELEAKQDLYDKETDHSKNKIAQQEWNNKIAKLLSAYQG